MKIADTIIVVEVNVTQLFPRVLDQGRWVFMADQTMTDVDQQQ